MSNKVRNIAKKNDKKESVNSEINVSSDAIKDILMNMLQLMIVSEANAQILVAKGVCTEEEYKEHLKMSATKFSLVEPEAENETELVDNITDINEINEMLLNRKKEESNNLDDLFIKKDEENDGE